MKRRRTLLRALVLAGAVAVPGRGSTAGCPPDAVPVGTTCVDRYEASVWQIPPGNTALVRRLQRGRATAADLLSGGAVQLSRAAFLDCLAPLFPPTFPSNGNWTAPVYAASVAGVLPTACITWFQAEQACAHAGKRLLTNQEWQRAAAGTPDPGTDDGVASCKIAGPPTGNAVETGSRAACVSQWGVFDMVGNVYEWVGTWTDRASACTHWPVSFGSDWSCVGGHGATGFPGAFARGGYYGLTGGINAGVFSTFAPNDPSTAVQGIGFRCGR